MYSKTRYLIAILGNQFRPAAESPPNARRSQGRPAVAHRCAPRPEDGGEAALIREDRTKLTYQVSQVGCPIRKSSDQRVFAPPRRLSQRITSFIACACQGIHQLPLRHLIILIANAHRSFLADNSLSGKSRDLPGLSAAADPRRERHTMRLAEKTSFSRSVRWPRSGRPIKCRRLSVSRRRTTGSLPRNSNKSSLHDVMQNRQKAEAFRKLFAASDVARSTDVMVEPDGIEPTTSCLQSRRSPS